MPHRRQAVEPRHQRVVQTRRDRERRQRPIEHIAIRLLAQKAALPAMISASAARAAANARSGINAMKALSLGSWRSIRANSAVAYSTGDNFLSRISSAASARPRYARSPLTV